MTGPILHPTHPDHDGPEWNRISKVILENTARDVNENGFAKARQGCMRRVALQNGASYMEFESGLAASTYLGVNNTNLSKAKRDGSTIMGWRVIALDPRPPKTRTIIERDGECVEFGKQREAADYLDVPPDRISRAICRGGTVHGWKVRAA